MSELACRAARLMTPDEVIEGAEIRVDLERGVVTALGSVAGGSAQPEHRVVDLGDCTIVPGLVDVHTHGGDGRQVNGNTAEEVAEALEAIGAFHAQHGTTAWLATTVTDTPERLLASVEGIALAYRAGWPADSARVAAAQRSGARVAGAHLEGPYIARARMGAQDPTRLRMPDEDELAGLVAASEGAIRVVTLAPELTGGLELMKLAESHGITVAIGHSDADYDTACRAFAAGARHVTHLFNAMPPLHHRKPGLIGAALTTPGVTLELIADLEHIHPAVLRLAAEVAPERIVGVSDSVPAAGLGEGQHRLGAQDVTVSGRRVELTRDPATLAGSLLTLDVALANFVGVVGVTLRTALRAVTSTPGILIETAGGPAGLGRLAVGGPADFAVLEPDLSVAATIVGGHVVHDPSGVFAST